MFGVQGKEEGIVDAEDKKKVKQKLQSLGDDFDKKEVELLQKNSTYQPQFSKYLEDRRELIGKKMALKYRRQAGLPNDAHGKPIQPYTNSSEAMNPARDVSNQGRVSQWQWKKAERKPF